MTDDGRLCVTVVICTCSCSFSSAAREPPLFLIAHIDCVGSVSWFTTVVRCKCGRLACSACSRSCMSSWSWLTRCYYAV